MRATKRTTCRDHQATTERFIVPFVFVVASIFVCFVAHVGSSSLPA